MTVLNNTSTEDWNSTVIILFYLFLDGIGEKNLELKRNYKDNIF
jgi:hypothetical protein